MPGKQGLTRPGHPGNRPYNKTEHHEEAFTCKKYIKTVLRNQVNLSGKTKNKRISNKFLPDS